MGDSGYQKVRIRILIPYNPYTDRNMWCVLGGVIQGARLDLWRGSYNLNQRCYVEGILEVLVVYGPVYIRIRNLTWLRDSGGGLLWCCQRIAGRGSRLRLTSS